MITDDADTILNAERIILPGVGAFGNAMAQLEKTGLDEVIREAVRRKPVSWNLSWSSALV